MHLNLLNILLDRFFFFLLGFYFTERCHFQLTHNTITYIPDIFMQLCSRIETIFVFKWHYSNEQCYLIYTKGNTEISVNKTLKGHLKKKYLVYISYI